MKLSIKFAILLTASACVMAVSIAVAMRWVVIDAVQQQSLSSKATIARTLGDRIADFVLTGDHYSADKTLAEVIHTTPDLEYIYVTGLDGKVFSHTFANGYPAGIEGWNPLNGQAQSIQLLETEKGFIHDIAVSMFDSAKARVSLGFVDTSLKKSLARIRDTILAITGLVIVASAAVSFFWTRALTSPLQRVVIFSQKLARGCFGVSMPGGGRDEIGQLVSAMNELSRQLQENQRQLEATHQQMCTTEKLSAMSRLSAGLAHELRNPLTAIKVLFNSLSLPGEFTEQDLEMVKAELAHMDGVLKRFLGFGRSDAMDLQYRDLNAMINEILILMRVPMQKQGISYSFTQGALTPVIVNGPLLEQALLNLFINAVEAMEEGGTLAIRTAMANDGIVITIEDSGSGIPEEIREQLFDPFVTSKKEGTGLGLFLVKNVITRHNGRIRHEPKEGRGTRFTISLPCKNGQQE